MAIQLGNTNIGGIYLGSTKISEAYMGSTKVFSSAPAVQYPYLLLQCDGYNGGHPNVSSYWTDTCGGTCVWTQVSASPNVWKLEITKWGYNANLGYGLLFLFGSNASPPVGTITHSCRLIGSGNMDAALDGEYCASMDRMFGGCTGLEYIDPIHCTTVENVGGMFSGCTNVEDGALDQYNWFNTYGVNIINHSGTFTDCGSSTTTGAAELDQIPVGWGGNLVPASTLMMSSVWSHWGTKSTWQITGNAPDWTNIGGLYLFTEASVSTYAGVSMNRSRITRRNGLATASGTGGYALYFYPAFTQYTGSSTSNYVITWVATTDTPNGSLTASDASMDMPGTLDYSTYGSITREYGTYDSNQNVFFLFLVTNVPIANWTGLTDAYGVLYNNNFKSDGGFRYFY